MFPILTFDERKLTPSLGFYFNARWLEPYESILGVLWKFARMNALPGHVVVTQLCRHPVDPYDGVSPTSTEVNVQGLARLLGVKQKVLFAGLGRLGRQRPMSRQLRYCSRCMTLGYHGVVHQLLGAMQCPVHGDWLEGACRVCGHASTYRLGSQLLDSPFRCPNCRRSFGRFAMGCAGPRPLPARMRTAITRAYLGGGLC